MQEEWREKRSCGYKFPPSHAIFYPDEIRKSYYSTWLQDLAL